MKREALIVLSAILSLTLGTDSNRSEAAGVDLLLKKSVPVGTPFSNISPKEFDKLYLVWPPPLKEKAARDPKMRREMALERYGFYAVPGETDWRKPPLGWIPNTVKGRWEANCLICHAGPAKHRQPDGTFVDRVILGAPNNRLDLMTFIEDRVKLIEGHPGAIPFSSDHFLIRKLYKEYFLKQAISQSRGTISAFIEAAYILGTRTPNMLPDLGAIASFVNGNANDFGVGAADVDMPAWWNTSLKSHIFIDGFAPLNTRSPMAAALSVGNPVKAWEQDFASLVRGMGDLKRPPYPGPINSGLAQEGRMAFNGHCASCHGTYENGMVTYPNRRIPIQTVKTDAMRLEKGITIAYRQYFKDSWLGYFGAADVVVDPDGYVAPPLKGIWATAPYLHNGSVPTLYHLLHPDTRPAIWKPDYHDYDFDRVGLRIDEVSVVPSLDAEKTRRYFDTRKSGKSAAGHLFPEALTEKEKGAVLEYLKTI